MSKIGLMKSAASLRVLLLTGLVLTSQQGRADEAAPVAVATASEAQLSEQLALSGTVTAERNSALSVRVSGLVAQVEVDAGDRVSAGDRLLQLDTKLAELALARADAAVDEAKAQLAEAKRLRNEARQLEDSRTIPETQVRAAEAQVAIRQAAVTRLQAERDEQAERLRRHEVVAPFAGVIARKLTEIGEWVDTGTPVLELVETDRLRLDVRAPQRLYQSLDEAMPVTVRSEALPGRELDGQVHARVPVNDPTARTFLVRVHINDDDHLLLPGMSAQAQFTIGTGERGIVIPRDAVIRLPNGTTNVWVIKQDEDKRIANRRQVKLGRMMADRVEVSDGLDEGQSVVVRGNEVLNEGQRVRIVESGD